MPRFFYNTNGFAFHRLEDVVSVLADLGYDGLALTPDVHHLDPFRSSEDDVRALRDLLRHRGLDVVIETGARFVLDPRRKHRPTLLDDADGTELRVDFLQRCVDMAAILGAPVVSVWSGKAPASIDDEVARQRLVVGLQTLCDFAASHSIRVGFEPEPGMFIERASDWPALRDAVGDRTLGLTLDIGHCLAMDEGTPESLIRAHSADLVVLQMDDHRLGVHEHLAFGEGDVDLRAVARAVQDVGFAGPLEVELSAHSSTAPSTAHAALTALREAFGED